MRKNDWEDSTYNAVVDYLYTLYKDEFIVEDFASCTVEVRLPNNYFCIFFSYNETKMFLSLAPTFPNVEYTPDMLRMISTKRFFGLENMIKAIDTVRHMFRELTRIEG